MMHADNGSSPYKIKITGIRCFCRGHLYSGSLHLPASAKLYEHLLINRGTISEQEQNGIYAVDLGFIPEKYRLDVRRVEIILNACLRRWLNVLEDSIRENRLSEVESMGAPAYMGAEKAAPELLMTA